MTGLEKSSSVGKDMRSEEVKELLTTSPLEYFCEKVSTCLESCAIEHKAAKVLLDAIVYILTEKRVVS